MNLLAFIFLVLYVSFIIWSIYTGKSWLEVFDEMHGKPRDDE